MGDVLSIADAGGDELVEYEYDEWGNTIGIIPTDSNSQEQLALANANPLRYRGYYLDSETGYYYLQSRYYDPSICRFINSDIAEIAKLSKGVPLDSNLFAYCKNNSTNNVDYDGFWVGFIGFSISIVLLWGISGMLGIIFDGKNIGVYWSFSYKCIGLSLGAGICGGYYSKYKTVYEFYNDKNIVTYSVSVFDFLSGKGLNGKYKGIQINIPLISSKAVTLMVSGSSKSKLYVFKIKTTKLKISSFVKKRTNAKRLYIKLLRKR